MSRKIIIKDNLFVLSLNIRSFFRHQRDLISMLGSIDCDPDIIILTETWLCIDNRDSALVDGYEACHVTREGMRSGGVSIFYKGNLKLKMIEELSVCNNIIESCVVELVVGKVSMNIVGIYRPHSGTIDEFTVALSEILDRLKSLSVGSLCLG